MTYEIRAETGGGCLKIVYRRRERFHGGGRERLASKSRSVIVDYRSGLLAIPVAEGEGDFFQPNSNRHHGSIDGGADGCGEYW